MDFPSFQIPDRPLDKSAPPVEVPARFRTWLEVATFIRTHNRALTWEQLEALTRLHDRLKREAPDGAPRRPPALAPQSAEDRIHAAWRGICAATPDVCVQHDQLAAAVAQELGMDGPRQIERVRGLYRTVGPRAVNRAACELSREALTPDQRFKFLEVRARAHKGPSGT